MRYILALRSCQYCGINGGGGRTIFTLFDALDVDLVTETSATNYFVNKRGFVAGPRTPEQHTRIVAVEAEPRQLPQPELTDFVRRLHPLVARSNAYAVGVTNDPRHQQPIVRGSAPAVVFTST
jgi:hypothetical protein